MVSDSPQSHPSISNEEMLYIVESQQPSVDEQPAERQVRVLFISDFSLYFSLYFR